MSYKPGVPTLKEIMLANLSELTAPVPMETLVSRILEQYPSVGKRPGQRVRDLLRGYDLNGVELVLLDPQTIVPLRLAMPDVRFRVVLGAEEAKQGMLAVRPGFVPFLTDRIGRIIAPDQIEFFDASDQRLPAQLVTLPIKRKTIDGEYDIRDEEVFDVNAWLRPLRPYAHDSVLVTILNWRPARMRLEFEPRAHYDKLAITAQNRVLVDAIQTLLDESYDQRIRTHSAILTALARMPSARNYPGDQWLAVLMNDSHFFVTDFNIEPSQGKSTLDHWQGDWDEPSFVEQKFTREQGSQVYRFVATQSYGHQSRIIEILGKHTFADFDDAMRAAFDLDFSDHLSEFTRVFDRGRGKKSRKQEYGEINPFEPTPAMKLRLAGLGLEVGAKFDYVYDFGDWLVHKLVLESMGRAERGVEYPRVLKQEKNSG